MASTDPRLIELLVLLRRSRERCGVTQMELARRLGRPQSWVAKVEAGERRLDLIELVMICESLDITVRDICPASMRPRLTGERQPSEGRSKGR